MYTRKVLKESLFVMRQFHTHRFRAGIPPDMQEQNTAEKKEESERSKTQGNRPISLLYCISLL